MKKQLILLFTLIFTGIFSAAAQDPIYVVNGQVVSDIRNIPPGDIESTEMLPADEQTGAWSDREMVRRALALLPLRQREVLHLKEIEGYPTHEIAALLTTDEAQVRVLLSRGRMRLRRELEKLMDYGI